MEKFILIIKEYIKNGTYGSIEVRFEEGRIISIKKIETIRNIE